MPNIENLVALKSASKLIQKIYDSYGYTLDTSLAKNVSDANTAEDALQRVSQILATDPTADLPVLPDTSIIEVGLPTINVIGPKTGTNIAGTSIGPEFADFSRGNISSGLVFNTCQFKEEYGCLIELYCTYGIWKEGNVSDKYHTLHGLGNGGVSWQTVNSIPKNNFVTKFVGYTSPPDGPGIWANNAAAVEVWITGDDISKPAPRIIGQISENSVSGKTWVPNISPEKKTYEVFVGWAGEAGNLINQLSPQVLTFSPATWHPLD